MDNPLLDFSGLPRFDAIRPDHVGPAIDALLAEAEAAVSHAQGVSPVSWDSFVTPLEDATERLTRAWGQVAHLQAVADTPALREAYNANLPKMTRFGAASFARKGALDDVVSMTASGRSKGFTHSASSVAERSGPWRFSFASFPSNVP